MSRFITVTQLREGCQLTVPGSRCHGLRAWRDVPLKDHGPVYAGPRGEGTNPPRKRGGLRGNGGLISEQRSVDPGCAAVFVDHAV